MFHHPSKQFEDEIQKINAAAQKTAIDMHKHKTQTARRPKWINIRILARYWGTSNTRAEILALARCYRVIRLAGEVYVSRVSIISDLAYRPGMLKSDHLTRTARNLSKARRKGES